CIQLVKQQTPQEPPPQEEPAESEATFRTSYVVYLPFRVTETAHIPLPANPSELDREVISSEHNTPPLQGAPPVPPTEETDLDHPQELRRILRFSVPQTVRVSRLRSLSDQLAEDTHQLEESTSELAIGQSTLHALVHTCDRLITSIGDVYHAIYNRHADASDEEEAKEALKEAFATLERVSSVIIQRMS
ncbi:hypothetical protein WA538_003451, partial [Blastocystis sp. DL]